MRGNVVKLAIFISLFLLLGCGNITDLGESGGVPLPDKVKNPQPKRNAQNVSISTALSWQPAEHAITYHVYFGQTMNLAAVISGTTWDPPGDLAYGTIYEWRVDSVNAAGVTTGDTWRFRTEYGPQPPVAGFTVDTTIGVAPLSVKFTDTSTGLVTSWAWDFNGDGNTDSTIQNPSCTYYSPGTFTVSLIATGPGGTDVETKTSYITVLATLPSADFSADPLAGPAPLTVAFTDLSTGTVTGWNWDFDNNGSIDSTVQNPTHQYSSEGTYSVKLTIDTPAGPFVRVRVDYITASSAPPPAPVAMFSATPTSGLTPLIVSFTDESTGSITDWEWDFDYDGSFTADSTTQNPTHIYSSLGTYSVALRVTGPGGNNTCVRSSYITTTSPPSPPIAGFSGTPTSGTVPLEVDFTDTSTGVIDSWLWSFGDGTTSVEQNPSHTYTSAGTYTVGLTVTNTGGSNGDVKLNYITVTEVAPVAGFSGTPTSGNAPLLVSFTDASTGSINSWLWSFGDGTTSISQNPSHSYGSAGTYTVTLAVNGPGGSDIETKTDYITVSPSLAPTADFVGDPLTGYAPLVVSFTDLTSGSVDTWAWDFDGFGVDSTAQNPTFLFSTPGTYTVKLTVAGPQGSDFETKTNYITVNLLEPTITSIDPDHGATSDLLYDVKLYGSDFKEGDVMRPGGAVEFNGHWYLYVGDAKTWHNAKADCEARGGHLATMSDATEDTFVYNLGGQQRIWFGFTDEGHEGTWVWITGEPVTYTNWYSGEPNNTNGNEHYTEYITSQWNDVPASSNKAYVCEFETNEPPSVILRKSGEPDITATNVRFVSSGELEFDLNLEGAAIGAWDVVVINPDSGTYTLVDGFTVTLPPPLPVVTAITPAPDEVLSSEPSEILVTFSKEIDASTVNATNFQLLASGGDGTFDDGNEIPVSLWAVTQTATNIVKMDLFGASLPDDAYQVSIKGDLGGNALSFDGSNDYVSILNTYDLGGSSFTVEAWIYKAPDVEGKFISKWNDNSSNFQFDFQTCNVPKKLWFEVREADNGHPEAFGTTTIDGNKWYHIAGVANISTSELSIYINGEKETLDSNPNWDGTVKSVAMEMNIGRKATGVQYWNGMIDEVRIWKIARTQGQIQADMYRTLSGSETGLVGYYRFDEENGQLVNDSSPFAYHGTLGATSSPGSDDPAWVESTAPIADGVKDTDGLVLDGEFSGTFPSGNDIEGGDFQSSFIIGNFDPPVADFTSDIQSGEAPLTVSFTDASTGHVNSWEWDFGETEWQYRKPITISNPNSQLTDYQIKVEVNHVIGKMQENYCDLRFTAGNGKTLLKHWIEEFNTSSATVWVKMNNIPSGDSNIYIYYGNPDALSSSTKNTFICEIDNLLAAWNFDEGTGNSTADCSGNNRNGTLTNGPSWATDEKRFGNASINFSTSDDYVQIPSVSIGSAWTLECWCRFPLFNTGSWRTMFQTASGQHHVLVQNDGYLGTYDSVTGSDFYSCGFDIDTLSSGWHHVVAVGSGSDTEFYIDGAHVGTANMKITSDINYIGNYVGGAQNVGFMDEPRIYGDALTSEEIGKLAIHYGYSTPKNPDRILVCKRTFDNEPIISGTGIEEIATESFISKIQNPSYTYSAAGTYTVTLKVSGYGGTDEEIKTGYITVYPPTAPAADFTAEPLSGYEPLTVSFTDQSTGAITTWSWDFDNDSTPDSTEQNPLYTYYTPGTYTVALTVSNPGGPDTCTKTDYIVVVKLPKSGLYDSGWPVRGADEQRTSCSKVFGPQTNRVIRTYQMGWGFGYMAPSIGQDGMVLSGCWDNDLYAFNKNGVLKWKYSGKSDYSPVVARDGTIYWGGSSPKTLAAIDPVDGSEKWWYNIGSTPGLCPSCIVGRDGTIYCHSDNGSIYAINPDGTLKWQFSTSSSIQAWPSLGHDGTIYAGNEAGIFFAINRNGTEKWRYTDSNPIRTDIAVAEDGTIYYCAGGFLKALSSSGSFLWNTPNVGAERPSIGPDGTIVVCKGGRGYIAYYPNGNERWRWHNDRNTLCKAAISADGTVYGATWDSYIRAIDIEDGSLKWSYDTGNWIESNPMIGDDGTLYFGSNDGKMYAFRDLSPEADFTANVTSGSAPLAVTFTDSSTGTVNRWLWVFGDGSTSTLQNPSHAYTEPGIYTVRFSVMGLDGATAKSKINYITVNE